MKRMRGYSNLGGRGAAMDETARDARLRALAERLTPQGRVRLRLGEDCARALRRALRDVSAMDGAGDDALNRLRSDAGRVEACLQQARAESGAKTLASEDEPRVLLLARELVDGGERLLTKELLLRKISLFDAARSLEMRELQLIPAALRIALCEALADVAGDVLRVAKSRAAADEWVRAGGKGRMRSDCDEAFFERALQLSLELEQPELHARVERAIERCGQRKDWLVERAQRIAADCCLRLDNLMQLKHLLDGLNWRRCFESLSPAEQELRGDPAGLYPRMDADSRARVRQQVESLARHARAEEIVVVRHALRLARAAMEERYAEIASANAEERGADDSRAVKKDRVAKGTHGTEFAEELVPADARINGSEPSVDCACPSKMESSMENMHAAKSAGRCDSRNFSVGNAEGGAEAKNSSADGLRAETSEEMPEHVVSISSDALQTLVFAEDNASDAPHAAKSAGGRDSCNLRVEGAEGGTEAENSGADGLCAEAKKGTAEPADGICSDALHTAKPARSADAASSRAGDIGMASSRAVEPADGVCSDALHTAKPAQSADATSSRAGDIGSASSRAVEPADGVCSDALHSAKFAQSADAASSRVGDIGSAFSHAAEPADGVCSDALHSAKPAQNADAVSSHAAEPADGICSDALHSAKPARSADAASSRAADIGPASSRTAEPADGVCSDALHSAKPAQSADAASSRAVDIGSAFSRAAGSVADIDSTSTSAAGSVAGIGLTSDDPRASVCWYLVEDEGRAALCREMGVRAPRRMLIDPSGRRSVALVCALTAAALAVILWGIGEPWLMVFGLPLAWGCAWRVLGRFYPKFVRPGKLLKLKLESVPEDARTLVALPVLLSGEGRAREMVARMEALGCLERDPNVDFLLLGDFRDGDAPHEPEDEAILRAARAGVARLNAAAGREKYHYLHRERKLREIDGRWMGENRKRGALMALNSLLLGREGAETAFEAEGACAAQLAGRYRYVITLDADTEYLPGTVQKLVGTMLHPFNRCGETEDGRICAASNADGACRGSAAANADGGNRPGSYCKSGGEELEGAAFHPFNRCRKEGEDGRSCAVSNADGACRHCTVPGADDEKQPDSNRKLDGEKPEGAAFHPSNRCREEGEDGRSCAVSNADSACRHCTVPGADDEKQPDFNRKLDGEEPEGAAFHPFNRCRKEGEDGRSCAASNADGGNRPGSYCKSGDEELEGAAFHPFNRCREEGEDGRSCAASDADGACRGDSALNACDGYVPDGIHAHWNGRAESDPSEGVRLAAGKPATMEAAAEWGFGGEFENAEASGKHILGGQSAGAEANPEKLVSGKYGSTGSDALMAERFAAGKPADMEAAAEQVLGGQSGNVEANAGTITGEKVENAGAYSGEALGGQSGNAEANAGEFAAGKIVDGESNNDNAAAENSARQDGRKSGSRNCSGNHSRNCSSDRSHNCVHDCSGEQSRNYSRNITRKNARDHSRNPSHSTAPLRRGYAVLQPDMALTAEASLSAYVELTAGRGGVDGYPTSVSDFYQDMTGRGCFAGKGIYDVRAFAESTEGALDDDGILSHDMIEGVLAGAGVVDDVRFYDGCPDRLGAELQRLHRWTRGDWQLLPVLCSKLRLGAVDRMKIAGNLLRSLYAPALLGLLMLAIWLDVPGAFALGLALAFLEPVLNLPFSLFGEGRRSWRAALLRLATLPATAFCQLDAILRTLWRLAISHKHLMDWVTAADASGSDARTKLPGRIAALLALPGMLRGQWIVPALGIAMLFWVGAGWADDLSRQRAGERAPLKSGQTALLMELARRTWHFFEAYVPQGGPGLPPDNVQLDPDLGPAMRTSPTNVGLYLMSCLAARELGLISDKDMRARMAATVNTLEGLEKWNGQLYNWYDIETLAPLRPRYVSAVDSGNLAGALLLCAHALRENDPALSKRLRALAEGMDLAALYDDERELFRIGMDVENGRLSESHYDLYASEARILSFAAMMLGQAPVKHWARLNRASVRVGNKSALLSWSGTMFEYLMPELMLRSPANSLAGRSREGVAAWQIRHGRRNHRPWGVSESGYYAFDGWLNYQYRAFGLPELALSGEAEADVIAPYAAALALCCDPAAATENLRQMCAQGWSDEFGLYEAADYARAEDGEGAQEANPACSVTADRAHSENGEGTPAATPERPSSVDHVRSDSGKRRRMGIFARSEPANRERLDDGERTQATTLARSSPTDFACSDDGECTHVATQAHPTSADRARSENGEGTPAAILSSPMTSGHARSDDGKRTTASTSARPVSADHVRSDDGARPQSAPLTHPASTDHAHSNNSEPRIVRSHMAHHQGMALCAICNALRGDVLAKMFMDIPEARALRLLLQEKSGPLPPRRGHSKPEPRAEHRPEASYSRGGRRNVAVDTHLLRGANTTALVTVRGATFVWSDGLQLTRFSGDLTNPHEGLFVHLEDATSGACTVLGRSGACAVIRKGSKASFNASPVRDWEKSEGTRDAVSRTRAVFGENGTCETFGKNDKTGSDAEMVRFCEESEGTQGVSNKAQAASGKSGARKGFGKNASFNANPVHDWKESKEMQDAASGTGAMSGENGARAVFGKNGRASFDAGLVRFHDEFEGIEAELRLCISPEDGALYQIVELENPGDEARELIVSGCMAVALAPERDMRAHPTFQNLFVEGEELTPRALLLRRRPRTPGQALPGLIYLVSGGESPRSELRLDDLLARTGSLGEPCGLRWELPAEGRQGNAQKNGRPQHEPSGQNWERTGEKTQVNAAMGDATCDVDRQNEADETHPSAATVRVNSQDQPSERNWKRSVSGTHPSARAVSGSQVKLGDAELASQSAGRALLNPCAALRVRVRIAPKSRVRLHFALLLIPAEEAEQVMREGAAAPRREVIREKAQREEQATQTTLEPPLKITARRAESEEQVEHSEDVQPENAAMGLPFAKKERRDEPTARATLTGGHEAAELCNAAAGRIDKGKPEDVANESSSAEGERPGEQAACEELTGHGWPSPLRGRAARAMEEDAAERALRLATAQARTVLMHAGVDGARFALYQRSAALLFDPKLRPGVNGGMEVGEPIDRRALWSAGVSGELPILLVELRGDDLSCVREGVRLHAFYRSMGVASDFVLVDCRSGGYRRNAGGELGGLIAASHLGGMLDLPGGAHIRERDGLNGGALEALRRAAALRLYSEGAPLTQLRSALDALKLRDGESYRPMPAVKLPPPSDLQYFNGFGGFRMGKAPKGETKRRAREADDMKVEFARDLGVAGEKSERTGMNRGTAPERESSEGGFARHAGEEEDR